MRCDSFVHLSPCAVCSACIRIRLHTSDSRIDARIAHFDALDAAFAIKSLIGARSIPAFASHRVSRLTEREAIGPAAGRPIRSVLASSG